METCSVLDRLRKPKLWDMSIFDWVTSILGAILIGYFFLGLRTLTAYIIWIIIWTIIGIIIHYILGINTMLGYYLGINPMPERKKC